VDGLATMTAITSDAPDPSVVGQPVLVQFSVSTGSGTPSGNVTVSDGTASCTAPVATGQCSLTLATAGAKALVASYSGDASYNSSDSVAEMHTVNAAATTTAITSTAPGQTVGGQPASRRRDLVSGESVTVHYAVTVDAPGAGTPTGTVTVGDGVDSCTATVAAGQCTITLTTAGTRTLTATYSGDANFAGSASAARDQIVDAPATTTSTTPTTPTTPATTPATTPPSTNPTTSVPSGTAPTTAPVMTAPLDGVLPATGSSPPRDITRLALGLLAIGFCAVVAARRRRRPVR